MHYLRRQTIFLLFKVLKWGCALDSRKYSMFRAQQKGGTTEISHLKLISKNIDIQY